MKIREPLEWAFVAAAAWGIYQVHEATGDRFHDGLILAILGVTLLKTTYYFGETLWHLLKASISDMAYHRFALLMAYNMIEIGASFAIDFYLLHRINPGSFHGIAENLSGASLLFEFFYFSVLNFSFFGYGDITPATIPAKILVLMEIMSAFCTVIFLLSDFVSLKESMRRRETRP